MNNPVGIMISGYKSFGILIALNPIDGVII